MAQQEEMVTPKVEQDAQPQKKSATTSNKVTDHLANERTFLAWIRTAISLIAIGFVVARFGLLIRSLGGNAHRIVSIGASTIMGVTLTAFGVVIMIVAVINFLHIRRAIDSDSFHPPASFIIVLAVVTCLAGILLAFYLFFTA